MLDIVITHYNEPWEVGEKLFRMIGLQRCVDMGKVHVTVVNDGGNRLPEEQMDSLPYHVEQIDIPHGGVSKARNTGLDHAKSKWIMFCDFDDSFVGMYSLHELMNLLDADMDMLWCDIVAEDYIDEKKLLYYVPEAHRFVFCHGKLYRREFLVKNNIRFDEELVFNEDSCFNAVIIARTPHERIGRVKSSFPIYAWIRRKSSVTNSGREDEATYGHFRRNLKVTEENRLHREPEAYRGMVTRTVYDTYYMTMGRRTGYEMKRKILKEFTPWIAKQISEFGKVDGETIEKIRQVARAELINKDEKITDRFDTVDKWVHGIVDTYRGV